MRDYDDQEFRDECIRDDIDERLRQPIEEDRVDVEREFAKFMAYNRARALTTGLLITQKAAAEPDRETRGLFINCAQSLMAGDTEIDRLCEEVATLKKANLELVEKSAPVAADTASAGSDPAASNVEKPGESPVLKGLVGDKDGNFHGFAVTVHACSQVSAKDLAQALEGVASGLRSGQHGGVVLHNTHVDPKDMN